ncbi:hypothetical protein GGI25_001452 [Coemansia spiralis]|uniref:Phorbol-ester/DAG-type domain-containing protein n=2 Tax=Coemansia TaxID=4863 RepID=A0A9W8GAF4_9FUNG|nr:hypothetical protein EDC05_001416 [Coemansia umbellata]KAJ2624505.1 hypothetical protein GGI26_001423 [Coemansia sp. RSA 1358]KAJ2679529.1 hypothetical protein GGI25_001452 [Coemansia spiralis]
MHNFVVTTFTSPTYCEYCSGFLWGVAKQGVRCSKCKATAHKKCALKAVTQCTGDRGLATLIPSVSPISRSSFHDSPEPTSPASNNEATVTDGYIAQLDGMFWQQLDKEIKINTLVSAQSEQPLSLFQTLPANFMQFTAKLAPLSFIHRLVKDVVFWRKPNHSGLAMAVYSMYCLRPNLLLATPLALLIAYIVFNYFNSGYWNKSGSLDAVDTKNRVSVSASSSSQMPYQSQPTDSAGDYHVLANGKSPSHSTLASAASGSSRGKANASGSAIKERRRSVQAGPYLQMNNVQADASSSTPLPPISTAQKSTSPVSADSSAAHIQIKSKPNYSDCIVPSDAHTTVVADGAQNLAKEANIYDGTSNSASTSPKSKVLVRARSSSEQADGSRLSEPASTRQKVDLEALFGVAGFGSAKYTDNVHTTQIMTGTYVRMYDWVVTHNYLVDWSQPDEAWHILFMCICAQMVLLVIVYWVPWYLLFLVSGNLALLSMSPHVRAFAKVYGVEFMLCAHEWIVLKWLRLRLNVTRLPVIRWILRRRKRQGGIKRKVSTGSLSHNYSAEGHSDGSDAENGYRLQSGYQTPPPLLSLASNTAGSSTSTLVRRPHMVSVFENQRWWLGFGWIPRLGTNERAKWSDEDGKKKYASINDFMPAEGYEWADDSGGWEVDRYWALPVCTDEDGWVYTDNFWRHPSATSSTVSSYTRRRKWMRKVRPAASRVDSLRITRPNTP